MAKTYCQWVGVILIVLGILGFLIPGGFLTLTFTTTHNLVHLVSGVILAYLGFTDKSVKTGAQVFGVIYTLVGLLGFVSAGTLAALGITTGTLYNLIHLVLGVVGLWAGFGQKEMAQA
ncbi:MAG: hypothetical protein QN157_07375 [Armatimonadota bacterium]|nr:hypothetical protein [Armatimonadota bacterium]